jgi:serine/threonine protein phosphatase PrpC
MGCDGIWEMINGDFICRLAHERLRMDPDVTLSEIAENILDAGLAPDTSKGYGCDNMSAIVIRLDHFKD